MESSRTRNLVWCTPLRPGKSSPVPTNKHVLLTGFENETLYTQCFDRGTGKLLWERSEPLVYKEGVNLMALAEWHGIEWHGIEIHGPLPEAPAEFGR